MYYRVRPSAAPRLLARQVLTPVVAWWHRADVKTAVELRSACWLGSPASSRDAASLSWISLARQDSSIEVVDVRCGTAADGDIPFVYESPLTPAIVELRERCGLDEVVGDRSDEYAAMLRLGAWAGTRWDHGQTVHGPTYDALTPYQRVEAGSAGAKFLCHTVARLTVQAAAAAGWPARVTTVSSDGYAWEHSFAELWSTQFDKWFVLDTDINVVYECDGRPLSAFELCHRRELGLSDGLVRVRRFAAPKPGVAQTDMLPLFGYVHVDLRSDWVSRQLARGSPAGGDLATWWSAAPGFGAVLTQRVREDDPVRFDWPMYHVQIMALGCERVDDAFVLTAGFCGYGPWVRNLEVAVDEGGWEPQSKLEQVFRFQPGGHRLRARMTTAKGSIGPESVVEFHVR